ncbi:hypothetical protein niasHT_039073 [Heterodera trifolii]|uniref:Possible tRNA binding domain-containing protein n=1 Tax=Heterodera trifolii TaxID=157864 RepID=A0ABD2HPL9_9BILA
MKQLFKQSVTNVRDKGKKRAAGDLIPWTLCQHFLISNEIGGPTFKSHRGTTNSLLCAVRALSASLSTRTSKAWATGRAVRLLLNFYGRRPRHISTTTAASAAQCQNGDAKNSDGAIDGEEDEEMSRVQLVDCLAFRLMFMDSASIGCSVQRQQGEQPAENGLLDRAELRLRMSDLDLRRVAQYCRNLADLALISDLLPTIAGLYFTARVNTNWSPLDLSQAAVLLGVGLQRKMVETVANELALSASQTHALLNK